ncbi:MAG: hypothetical protein A2Z34_12145 [Planctomycetes bacterium RBG_16_59_8]|nr:MAG: hypothetical protein A2Z34_12145 [Planctomycetes bacterium RBG_16_59_8]
MGDIYFVVTLNAGEFILDRMEEEIWDAEFTHFRLFKEMNMKLLTENANIFLIPVANPQGYQYSKEIALDLVGGSAGRGQLFNRCCILFHPAYL